MALSVKMLALAKICAQVVGGVARVWAFDNEAFDFTQAAYAQTTGYAPYTAVALTPDGTTATAKLYPLQFERDQAEYTVKQSRKGSVSKYTHQLDIQFADLRMDIVNWNNFVDQASICTGVGLIIQLNNGKFFVIGEKIVNSDPIDIPFYVVQDGSSASSGKVMDDFNGQNTTLKGDYIRGPIEFTGTLASLTALE